MVRRISMQALPSVGALSDFGNQYDMFQHQQVLNLINSNCVQGSRYFGTEFDRYKNVFTNTIQKYIAPLWQANEELRYTTAALTTENIIRPLTNEEALLNVPACMMVPVLAYKPMYDLLRTHRIQGYGDYTAEEIAPYVEQYQRLLWDNGHVNLDTDIKPDNTVTYHYEYHDDDPYLTLQQKQDLRETMEYVQQILDDTDLDPTAPDLIRG